MINFVMLTWNRLTFVKTLVESFYSTKGALEYNFFIIDNASTDGTAQYLEEVAKSDANIKLFINDQNFGLQEYKRLFDMCSDGYIIILDDDVISFPYLFDVQLVDVLRLNSKIGFISLDVVQNEFTNGAKPGSEHYRSTRTKQGVEIDIGPAGGWCAAMRHRDFKRIRPVFSRMNLSMANGEDGTLVRLMKYLLFKKIAVLKGVRCLHATGPYYSKEFGFLKRDIEKYERAGLVDLAELYKSYL